jgi:hypothetical protein
MYINKNTNVDKFDVLPKQKGPLKSTSRDRGVRELYDSPRYKEKTAAALYIILPSEHETYAHMG